MAIRRCVFALPLTVLACGADSDPPGKTSAPWEEPGPRAVGHAVLSFEDTARERKLDVHLWYPAGAHVDDQMQSMAVSALVPEGEARDTLASLVAEANDTCTRRVTGPLSHESAIAEAEPFPLVVFSHCHGCLGIFSFGIAERLASHGFVVAAPDHAGDTLFESLEGTSAPLHGDFLAVRAGDIRFVMDTLLDAESMKVPAPFRGRFDAERVGIFGHSYGGATTGLVLQDDPRPKAGMSIAAPMESPLLRGPKMANIDRPVAFLLAREDNSIGEIGNAVIRSNFEAARRSAWLVEVADAGHWSFSDLCAVTEKFRAGCGEGKRQTGGEPFTYLDNARARDIGAAYVTAFMAAELTGNMEARDYLGRGHPEAIVTATRK